MKPLSKAGVYEVTKNIRGDGRMTKRSGYGLAIALPFFVLWLTTKNIAFFCIAIALSISLGMPEKKKK